MLTFDANDKWYTGGQPRLEEHPHPRDWKSAFNMGKKPKP